MKETDVLIIGGGPSGTVLALELSLQHIPFRIIDKSPGRPTESRALVIQPRTLELLSRHGISHDLTSAGTIGTGASIYVNKFHAASLDLSDLGFSDQTAFPLPLWISQADTEHCLDAALARHGYEIERPITAEEIVQDESGVTATLRNTSTNTTETVRAKYVIGCDGAHSVVRHAAGLSFEGAPYPQDFILADTYMDWSAAPKEPELTFFMGQGMMIMFPLKDGLFRLITICPSIVPTPKRHKNDEPTLEDFQKVFNVMAPGTAKLRDPVWLARFRLHHRGVENYRKGRLFVAGDAAHIHSPAGGQGMNTGIQDAVNLGWKLASVLKAQSPSSSTEAEALLDSYSLERHRIGQYLLKGTDRIFSFGSSQNWLFITLRNFLVPWVAPWVFASRERRARFFRFMSELGIRYRHSTIVGTGAAYRGALKGGDRAVDGELEKVDRERNEKTRFLELCKEANHHLVLFSGIGNKAVDDVALQAQAEQFLQANGDSTKTKVHKIFSKASPVKEGYMDEEGKLHLKYGFISEPGYVLVRPDGYIAHIGLLKEMDYLREWLKGYPGM